MLNLNLWLDDVPPVNVELAKAPIDLSEVGKLGRWLFLLGLKGYVQVKGGDVKPVDKYIDTSWQSVNKRYLITKMKCPLPFDNDYNNPARVLLQKGFDLRSWFRDYVKEDTTIPIEEKNLFMKGMSFLVKGKDLATSGVNTMEKIAWSISNQIGEIFNNAINGAEKVHSNDIVDMFADLKDVIKRLTGKAALKLDPTISAKAKTDKKLGTLFKEYQGYMAEIKKAADVVLKKETVNGPVDSDVLEKKFKSLGFEMVPFPSFTNGFKGMIGTIDGKMSLYTSSGDLLFGGVHPEAKVKINPLYDPKSDDTYYLQYTAPNAVSTTRVYTAEYRNTADTAKHKMTSKSLNETGKWITRWQKDMKSKDLMIKVPAVVAYLLYMTGARVGSALDSVSLTGKGQTYGISTLTAAHAKVTGTSIMLEYVGKKQVIQKHILNIKDDPHFKICADVITKLKVGKKSKDLLFSFKRPANYPAGVQNVTGTFFTKYMKGVGVPKVHGMRHVRGTKLAQELLNTIPWKPGPTVKTLKQRQTSADQYIKEKVLTKVGELLGHKSKSAAGVESTLWSTCIKSYVTPKVIADWYKKKELNVPSWVPRKIEVD